MMNDSSKSPIVLGCNASITGPAADLAMALCHGFELAIREYNARGGYQGIAVKALITDDQLQPTKAAANAATMIEEGVCGLIGTSNTITSLFFNSIAQKREVPVISPIATSPLITEQFQSAPRNYIFRMAVPDQIQLDIIAAFFAQAGWEQVGLLINNTAYGIGAESIIRSLLPRYHIRLRANELLPSNAPDALSHVNRLKDAGVKYLWCHLLSHEQVQVLQAAQALNYKLAIIGPWTLTQPAVYEPIIQLLGEAYTISLFESDRTPASRQFHQAMVKTFQSNGMPTAAAQSYDATRLLLHGLDAAGPNPIAVRDALEVIMDFAAITAAPPRPFSADNHEGLKDVPLTMVTYQNQRWVPVQASVV